MTKLLLASATSGILVALAFPPWQFDMLAWIGLIPLFWSISNSKTAPQAVVLGWVYGLCFFSIDVRWIYDTLTVHGHFSEFLAFAVLALMIAILAMSTGAFSYLSRFAHKSGLPYWIIFPTAWVSIEYVRTYIFTGFPWDLLGYSLSHRPNLIQIADITGVYGLSFLLVFVNGSVFEALVNRGKSYAGVVTELVAGIFLIATCAIYGWTQIAHYEEQSAGKAVHTVGILQGAIPQGVKWSESYRSLTFQTYEELAKHASSEGASLLIWPETSVPVVIGGEDLSWMGAMEISKKLKTPMLIGAPSQTDSLGTINYFNSAFLVNGSEILSDYDKIHLVPFGEYMPLGWLLPLGPGMAAREADFTPGSVMTVMKSPGLPPFSVLICYEAIFPDLSRMAILNGAHFLVNITNDGWFDTSSAPFQHLSMAKFRAIENRTWLLRAANTGISGAFDPTGHLTTSIPLGKSGWINIKMPDPVVAASFYTKFGDVFALSCIMIFSMTFFVALVKKEKSEGFKYDSIRH